MVLLLGVTGYLHYSTVRHGTQGEGGISDDKEIFVASVGKSGLYKREKVWYTESAVEYSSHIMRGCDGNKYVVRKTLQRAFGW